MSFYARINMNTLSVKHTKSIHSRNVSRPNRFWVMSIFCDVISFSFLKRKPVSQIHNRTREQKKIIICQMESLDWLLTMHHEELSNIQQVTLGGKNQIFKLFTIDQNNKTQLRICRWLLRSVVKHWVPHFENKWEQNVIRCNNNKRREARDSNAL